MKNRVLVAMLVVLLVGTFVFAAGSQETKEKSVTFWMQAYGDRAEQMTAMDTIASNFKAETGIALNYEIIDWSNVVLLDLICRNGGLGFWSTANQ